MHSSSASDTRELQRLMRPNPVIVDRDTTLDEALTRLEHYGIRHLPVVECNRVLGMLSDRDLLLATGLQSSDRRLRDARGRRVPGPERVGEVLRQPVHCLPGHASMARAAQDMLRLGIGAIPVVEDRGGPWECLVGIVTETDLLRAFLELCRGSRSCDGPARSHMHQPMPWVARETSIEGALELLDRRIGHLCVRQEGKLVGIVSDRDLRLGLARSAIRDARAQSERRMEDVSLAVASVMTARVFTAEPDTPLSCCAGRLLDHKISALPILEGGLALGILTQRNVLEHFATVASRATSRPARERSGSSGGERR